VSQIIRVLSRSSSGTGDWHIAIKSGGHHLPGVSSIANGVTIDLAMMNSSSYNPQTGLASIQPGARWGDVYYNLLRTANVTVMGGRDGGVGVGGFLLGGGISFHTGRHGFACNAVVNMEIVLANGSIISTNENEHPGLFKSLKGGSSNLGIVTRFDVETMPAVDIGFGISVFSSNHSEDIQRAFVDFTDAQEENKDDALVTLYSYGGGESSNASRIILRVNTQGDLETPSFDKFNEIPAIHSTWERISLPDALNGSSVTTITRYEVDSGYARDNS
jgi:FAD/FMN-containing dehydrogenase